MKTLIIALAAATAFAAPALAQIDAGPAAAIAHFNQDHDTQDGRRIFNGATSGVTVSTRSGDLSSVYARFNADAESQDEITGLTGATAYSGSPAFGAAIFQALTEAAADQN